MSKAWKRVVACWVVPAVALVMGCGPEQDAGTEPAAGTPPAGAAGAPGVMVSPELFDLVSRWSSESLGSEGVRAQGTATGKVDLVSYVSAHAPELSEEARKVVSQALGSGAETRGLQAGCSCQILSAVDAPSNYFPGGGWYVHVAGAAHSGNIYQNLSGELREQVTSNIKFQTQLRTRLACLAWDGSACAGSCNARLYGDVLYSSRIDARADTGGIWNKGATGQVVDGVTLDLKTPWGSGSRIFEKAAAISHFATNTTFNPQELANVVKGVLNIGTAIVGNDPSKISSELSADFIKALFGLINRSGTDGNTTQMLNVKYQSPFESPPIEVSYSSTDNNYYGLELTTDLQMKTRGWGGWHMAEGSVASSLLVAAYIDNISCSPGLTPPRPSGFWRYDSFANAPYNASMLQDRARNFFSTGGFGWVDVSSQQGTVSR